MPYPVKHDADRAPAEGHPRGHDFSEEHAPADGAPEENWQDGAAAFPLAYAYPEDAPAPDYAAEQEAADIEATLLGDLEAAATAFWTDIDADDAAGHAGAEAEQDGAQEPLPDENGNQYDFRWPESGPEEFVGPEIRRTLIAFRPPRKRDTARADDIGAELRAVNFDVHATTDGAFADDLAARNKEFYDLLKTGGGARKIAVPAGPARGPRFETIFPRAEPAPRHRRQAAVQHAGSGLARQAVAAAVLAIVVGVGIFIIAQQFSIPAEPEGTALLADGGAKPPPVTAPAGDETEIAPAAPAEAKPMDGRPIATVPTVDPGTLTTPPLYETLEPAGGSVDIAEPTPPAPELAAIPLRGGVGDPAANADTPAAPEIASSEPDAAADDMPVETSTPTSLSSLPEPAVEDTASEPPPAARDSQKPERESVTIAAAKPSQEKPAAGNSRMLRIAAGAGKVNSSVNMRAGPDNDAKVVRVLRAGTPVEIIGCKFWCEVIADGDRGFVFQRFISRTGTANEDAEPAPAEKSAPAREETRGPLNLLRFGRQNN